MTPSFLGKLLERIDKVGSDDLQAHLHRLAREKGFLETIFNTLQEGILVVDPKGRIIYFNHSVQTLLGMSAEAVGEPVVKYLRDLDWDKILTEERLISRDFEITYPETRYLSSYLVPLGDEKSGVHAFAMILHDLTSYRDKTRETIESEKVNALTLLAAGVAHELGNPLNSLIIHFQLLERELKKMKGVATEPIQESLNVVRSEIERLDTIINQFLRAVRPTPPVRVPEMINDVIRESVAFLTPELRDRDILVETDLSPDLPAIEIDRDRIKQVIYNLIKNAIQAMRPGGMLRLMSQQDDTHVIVSVIDNGEGIKAENLSRIFEPYFTTKASGTGLGLLIVRRIVREHGGEIQIESHVGRGTVVRVLLPLVERRIRFLPPSSTSGDLA